MRPRSGCACAATTAPLESVTTTSVRVCCVIKPPAAGAFGSWNSTIVGADAPVSAPPPEMPGAFRSSAQMQSYGAPALKSGKPSSGLPSPSRSCPG